MRPLLLLSFITMGWTFFAAHAASGPLAKGFGVNDWLDKIHVVISVFGLVVATTLILVFLILRKK